MKTLIVLCLAALAAGAQTPPAKGPAPSPPLALPPPAAAAPEPPDPNDPLDEAPPPEVHKGYGVRKKITAPLPPGEPADVLVGGNAFGGGAGGGFGGGGVGASFDPTTALPYHDFTYARGGKAARSVVIESREPDPNAIATVEEDLNVMSRILEKAISPSQDETKRVMGIEVRSWFGPAAGARNLYLEGYGAVFLLNVDLPLLAPPEGKTEPKAKEPASSEWEDARQEIYGNPLQRQSELSWARAAR